MQEEEKQQKNDLNAKGKVIICNSARILLP